MQNPLAPIPPGSNRIAPGRAGPRLPDRTGQGIYLANWTGDEGQKNGDGTGAPSYRQAEHPPGAGEDPAQQDIKHTHLVVRHGAPPTSRVTRGQQ